MYSGEKRQPTNKERMSRNQLCSPQILRSYMLFAANNGLVCSGWEIRRMNEDRTVLVLAHFLFFTPRQLSLPIPKAQRRHVSLNFGSINTVIQEMKAKAGRSRERKYIRNVLGRAPNFRNEFSSDEEDDALGDHDLVIVLHFAQCSLDLC